MRYRGRFAALASLLMVLAAAFAATEKPLFDKHQKAAYLSPPELNFIRPGFQVKILDASVAQDGTITTRFRISDPKDQPLDREGILAPGTISLSFIAAHIPQGSDLYTAYTTRRQTSPITGESAVQASSDTGGKYEKVGEGEYIYTFGAKFPSAYNATTTHAVGVYGSRNLTEFDLGTNFDDDVFHFVPNGSAVVDTREVVAQQSCNQCHGQLAFHGGSRRSVELCVLCHTPQTTDPDTGNSVDMAVMVHKIHMGENLPSVEAGGKYQIIGFGQSVHDYSTVVFPVEV